MWQAHSVCRGVGRVGVEPKARPAIGVELRALRHTECAYYGRLACIFGRNQNYPIL